MNKKIFSLAKPSFHLVQLSLILLEIMHFLIRWVLIHSPFFTELDYDQSIIGLMALHIMRGEPQLMLWDQPRMGGLEAYLGSFWFYLLGPSTKTLQLSQITVSSVILLVIYGIGNKVGGVRIGLIAAAYWALSPIFLTFTGNYVTGGHLEAILFGSFMLYGTCLLTARSSRKAALLIGLLGILAGVGWWSSLLIFPFFLAVAIGILGFWPGILLSPLPWLGVGGYLLGSLPFWIWNYFHDFNTFVDLGGKSLRYVINQLPYVFSGAISTFIGTYWDGQSVSSFIPRSVGLAVLIGCYLPALLICLVVTIRWIWRIITKELPFKNPVDYVVLLIWAFIFLRASGEPEDLGLTRYTLVLYVPLSILISFWITQIINFQKSVGRGILFGLLAFNLLTNIIYLEKNKNQPIRPVDNLIKAFHKLGISYCYGDNRVTQVITFESLEKVIAADYLGVQNYQYLRAVDRAPSQTFAILSHKKLGNPFPETLEGSLELLGGHYEKEEIGEFVFWYHFKEPNFIFQSIPGEKWKVTASHNAGDSFLIKDRDIFTAWRISQKPGDWLNIDLGQTKRIGKISILPGPVAVEFPHRLRLEISQDGKSWKTLREVKEYSPGFYWYQGHPKRDQNPRIQIFFPPEEGRFLRIINETDVKDSRFQWSIAELFIYEVLKEARPEPGKAQKFLDQAENELSHWMDDSTGPHPLLQKLSMDFRKRRVKWPLVIQAILRAIKEDPDREEAHQLLAKVIMLGDMLNRDKLIKKKPFQNPLDLFPKTIPKIPSKDWRVSSNLNSQDARAAFDGNPFSRWTSLRPQEPGMFYQVCLGDVYPVSGFSIFMANSLNDSPRALTIMGSSDGKNWREIQSIGQNKYAFDDNWIYKKTTYVFSPVPISYLKLIQSGADPVFWWSINEFEIYQEAKQE